MWVSGYLWEPKRDAGAFLLAKWKGLVVPVWLFGLIGSLKSALFGEDTLRARLTGLLFERSGHRESMWFVAALFSVELLFYLFFYLAGEERRRRRLLPVFVLLSAAAGILFIRLGWNLPWQAEQACVLLPFFCMGYWFRLMEKRLPAVISSVWFPLFLWAVYAGIQLLWPNTVNIHAQEYQSGVVFALQSFVGTTALALSCRSLCAARCGGQTAGALPAGMIPAMRVQFWKLVLWIGQNTLSYFFLQGIAVRAVLRIWPAADNGWCGAAGLAAAVYFFCAVPAYLIRRFAPFMLGRF
nr:acyltransferase family protein [Lachnoclostridium sp. Marseille-P6806]